MIRSEQGTPRPCSGRHVSPKGMISVEHQDDNSQNAARLRFARDLKRVKREAGEPSFRVLHTRSSGVLASATVSRVLSGKAKASWPFTKAYLRACEVGDDEIEAIWRPKWVQMMDVLQPLDPDLADASSEAPNSSITCADCGLVVGDRIAHQTWHLNRATTTGGGVTLRPVPGNNSNSKSWTSRRKAS